MRLYGFSRVLYTTLLPVLPLAACTPQPSDPRLVLEEQIDALVAPYADSVQVAVSVRDVQTGLAFDRNPDRLFHAASTMKVPVMIEVFRQAEQGAYALADSITVKTTFRSIADTSTYVLDHESDSDQALYDSVGQAMSIRSLTHRMINVSSNLATNLLIEFVGAENVQATIERLGATRMQVLRGVEDLAAYRQNLNNSATAADLALLLTALANGEAVSPTADRAMIGILLEQQFDEMIPAGLPAGTPVAHKTGRITAIHHDAAIVRPDGPAPYVLVILTQGFHDDRHSATLGADIARVVHEALRGTD